MAKRTNSKSRSGGRTAGRSGSTTRRIAAGSTRAASRGGAAASSGTSRGSTTRSAAGRKGATKRGATGARASKAASRGNGKSNGKSTAKSTGRASHMTADHEEIRQWAEERGGRPACVMGTGRGGGDEGIIRIMFPGAPGSKRESLKPISWDDFFEKFDEQHLALIYQDRTRGARSNFNKLVSRENG